MEVTRELVAISARPEKDWLRSDVLCTLPCMATIAVLGTLDTKGEEHGFVASLIRGRGHRTLVIDVGALDAPTLKADIAREEVARAGGVDLAALVVRRDRGEAVTAMAGAATAMLAHLLAQKKIDGVISLGGGGGTAIATAAMRALPIGFPKLMVSTLASGNTAQYVGVKDIVMMPSIVDVAGLNRISREILTRAAGAICGMVEFGVQFGVQASACPGPDTPKRELQTHKPIIVASMFGNTTDCVQAARKILEAAGYEVLVFHATGTGGRTMESLIESGLVAGVLDITTTEWADELVGGFLSAGVHRHGEFPRARNRAVKIQRPKILPAQPTGDAHAHHAGGERTDGPHLRGEAERLARPGDGAVAAARGQRDRRSGWAFPRSGGGRSIRRGVEGKLATRHLGRGVGLRDQ